MRAAILVVTLLVALVFSFLNTDAVTVHLLVWRFDAMLAVVVIGALLTGLLLGALLMAPWGWREHRACRRAEQRAVALEKRLDTAPERTALPTTLE